jgi:hypothetical protein
MHIPIDDLDITPRPYSETRYGHIHAFDNTIPVEVVVASDGHLTITYKEGLPNLGQWFEAISYQLSKEHVEKLLKKESVRL